MHGTAGRNWPSMAGSTAWRMDWCATSTLRSQAYPSVRTRSDPRSPRCNPLLDPFRRIVPRPRGFAMIDLRGTAPGLAVSAVVATAATFLSNTYHASAMLFALLLGMSLNFLAEEGRCQLGIQWASTVILRIGVALLGLRITVEQVTALG